MRYRLQRHDGTDCSATMVPITVLRMVPIQRYRQRLGFSENITFYSARHSYASALYHANVPMGLIAQNMGRNPAEIETYLKEFDIHNIYKANEKAFIVGQDDYKNIKREKENLERDRIRKELEEKGELELLNRLEGLWRFF